MANITRVLPSVLARRRTVYVMRDQYTTAVAAGSVNGTAAVPGPGTRTVTDSAGTNLLLTGGACQVTRTGSRDPLLRYGAIARVAGEILYAKRMDTGGRHHLGWYGDTALTLGYNAINPQSTGVISINDLGGGASALAVGTYIEDAYQEYWIVLRAAGAYYFTKGGTAYPYATLLWAGKVSTITPLYPGHAASVGDPYLIDEMAVVSYPLWLPSPLASDGMSAETTDGAGHAETTGLGAGGSGKAYTDIGTWEVAAGVKFCSALDGGIGISIVDCGKADVLHHLTITRSGDNVGVVVRYASATNYVYAYTDGTNVTLRKVVDGVDSQVLAPVAVTYAAAKDLAIHCYGTKCRVFYNNAAVGAEQTISDATLQSGMGVGLYTTNTGNTFDNLITYARGTGAEHESPLTF